MTKNKSSKFVPLYLDQLTEQEIAQLTSTQLKNVKVKNHRDQYSTENRIYQLAAPLELTIQQTHNTVEQLRAVYTRETRILRVLCKDFHTYLMFVFRWRARGLSLEQSMEKAVLEATARLDWINRQNAYWRKK